VSCSSSDAPSQQSSSSAKRKSTHERKDEFVSLIFLSIVAVCIVVIAGLVAFTQYIAHSVERALPPQGRFIDIGSI
jgi:hypothetical protein